MKPTQEIPSLLCGHAAFNVARARRKAVCRTCDSFWDLHSLFQNYQYGDEYPEERNHFDAHVGAGKVKALEAYLSAVGPDLSSKVVFETGFGGGYTLQYLHRHAKAALGLEEVQANLTHAQSLGVPQERLWSFSHLPSSLPTPVDFWVFLDSFEHLDRPDEFLAWMNKNSSPHATLLIVCPRADALSQTLLGRLWPHRLPDHKFHWSKKGLVQFLKDYQFTLVKEFYPIKYVTLGMIVAHIAHKFNLKKKAGTASFPAASWALPFNFGEMGLFLKRHES